MIRHFDHINQTIIGWQRFVSSSIGFCVLGLLSFGFQQASFAQAPSLSGVNIYAGDAVPRDVREIYDRGLGFLQKTQTSHGGWPSNHRGAGVPAMALMCFLASGEDPNYGMYSGNIRRAARHIIEMQDKATGYFGGSMYHHGFGMLGLAEAYGVVDDRSLWRSGEASERAVEKMSIGQSLELAVRCAVTSQENNSTGAWRYNPSGNEADTSVTGAVLMGLLAARNAGIEVPDKSIDKAIGYFAKMTTDSGQVAYSGSVGGFNESLARIAIGSLVYSIARRKDLPQYKKTLEYLQGKIQGGTSGHGGIEYQSYYQAQALFQGDIDSWEKWNKLLIGRLKSAQGEDGSIEGTQGQHVATTLSLLALAVNFRFLPVYER